MVGNREQIVVGLGEALFDRFSHQDVLGGAPLNVAIHAHAMLQHLQGEGVVASRVGEDPLGRQVCDCLTALGMDASFIQRDSEVPTGDVRVDLCTAGSPTYTIRDGVAWDRLEFTDHWHALAEQCDAVAFGTLAQRQPTSRATIHRFLDATKDSCLRVFDVNLRQNFYDRTIVEASLRLANVVKINAEELKVVSTMLQLPASDTDEPLRRLMDAFDLSVMALTRGALGTRVLTRDAEAEGVVQAVDPQVNSDSVGAGDACCAGLIVGLLQGWSLDDTVLLANQAGAFVASQAGATPALPPSLGDWIRNTQDQ